MDSQKVKNKKFIGLIYYILTGLMTLAGLLFTVYLIFFVLSLVKPDFKPFFPVIDIPIEIHESGTLQLKNGTQNDIFINSAFVSFNINEKYGFSGVLNYLYFLIVIGIGCYITFLLWTIFKSIRKSIKDDNPFHYKNVWRIRYLAFAIFGAALLDILYPLILKYFWFSNINLFDKTFNVRLNFDSIENIIWAFIILVIAEIYRIGLEIKKDQELTI